MSFLRQLNIKIFFVFLVFFCLLILRLNNVYQDISKHNTDETLSFDTVLLSEPSISKSTQRFTVYPPHSRGISVVTTRFPTFRYADSLHISGKVTKQVPYNEKTVLTMSFPKIEAKKQNPFLSQIGYLRQRISDLLEISLPQTPASLLLGIVFGIKKGIPKDFQGALRTVGVFHVVAASGMNITMVSGFLLTFFGGFLKRQIAVVCSIVGILFYSLFSGFEPSIVRAAIMGVLPLVAQLFGRQYIASYGLLFAGYCMLFMTPLLLFDIGFQLSFVSCLGLLYLRPLFVRGERGSSLIKKSLIGEDLITTFSAQLATLPILLANFGSYSLLSILVNCLVLWTIPILMVLGFAGSLFGLLIPIVGSLFLFACLPFLLFFEKIVTVFSGFGLLLQIQSLPSGFVIGYYLLLLSFVVFSKQYEHSR